MLSLRDRIENLIEDKPNIYIAREVASKLGVSREYVRQVVNAAGISHLLDSMWERSLYKCECGRKIMRIGGLCHDCYWKKHGAERLELICDNCGKAFKRNASEAKRNKQNFCGRYCLGQYAGNHYGFPIHKQFASKGVKTMELKITEITKAELPPARGRFLMEDRYKELINRCATLEDDKALRVACDSKTAQALVSYFKRRREKYQTNIFAHKRTESDGFYLYVYKVSK